MKQDELPCSSRIAFSSFESSENWNGTRWRMDMMEAVGNEEASSPSTDCTVESRSDPKVAIIKIDGDLQIR